MGQPPRPQSEWVLTEGAFARLLACLDPDAEAAGEKYRNLHLKLVKFFDWHGAHVPEECANETLNRVARKLEAGAAIQDLPSYCHGVARLVLLEASRRPDSKNVSLDELGPAAALESVDAEAVGAEDDERRACFTRCLGELPDASRRLILDYYRDERRDKIDNRLALAEGLGIPLNALRSRAQRLRKRLEECVHRCLRRKGSRRL
jgi:DNA-directed RNA polymerase specialized sigma24 family protein